MGARDGKRARRVRAATIGPAVALLLGPATAHAQGAVEAAAPEGIPWSPVTAVCGVLIAVFTYLTQRSKRRSAQDEAERAREEAEVAKRRADENEDKVEVAHRELRESIRKPVRVRAPDVRNSVILVGIGGTGKTSLIRHLIRDKNANPEQRTEEYALYHGTRSNDGDGATYHLYVSDYRGQNIGTLIRAFILQQKEPWSPMAYGYVGALIVMVDAVAPADYPDDDEAPRRPKQMPMNAERVQQHLQQWTETALDAVFGLLTRGSLKGVCLFINKADVMSHADRDRVEDEFKPLKQILRRRAQAQGAEFAMIFGSARNGDGLPALENALQQCGAAGEGA